MLLAGQHAEHLSIAKVHSPRSAGVLEWSEGAKLSAVGAGVGRGVPSHRGGLGGMLALRMP